MTFDAIAGDVNHSTVSTREIYAFPTTLSILRQYEQKALRIKTPLSRGETGKTLPTRKIKKTRPSVRVHWVACGTCSVPGNFFQVGVCSRYNTRSDWLIVTGPRADYGLAKTKQKVIQKPYNKLLTNRASSSRTGEYWPWVVFVRTSLLSVRTATTSGQYFPGSTALALG